MLKRSCHIIFVNIVFQADAINEKIGYPDDILKDEELDKLYGNVSILTHTNSRVCVCVCMLARLCARGCVYVNVNTVVTASE